MIYRVGHAVLFVSFLLGTLQLQAQSPQVNPADLIQLREVETKKIASPQYNVSIRRESLSSDGRRDWLMVRAEYDTAKRWTDEITFTFYVVLQGKAEDLPEGAEEMNLFSGTVTIVNVPQVRKGETTMFLDPYTLARFGEPTHVAVVVNVDGQPAAGKANPEDSARSQWWTKKTPNQTPLLTRDKTPYALVEIDMQNTIKP